MVVAHLLAQSGRILACGRAHGFTSRTMRASPMMLTDVTQAEAGAAAFLPLRRGAKRLAPRASPLALFHHVRIALYPGDRSQ
jgi:hypothetical protein